MSLALAICVTVVFAMSIYLMLGRDLKEVAMGVFLLGHAANLGIIAMSGSPVRDVEQDLLKTAPILAGHEDAPVKLAAMVDPLPQALILTAIVISFAVMAFLLTLIVLTARQTGSTNVDELSLEQVATP